MAIRPATPGGGSSSSSPFPPAAPPAASQTPSTALVPAGINVILPNGSTITVPNQAQVDMLKSAIQTQQTVDLRQNGGQSSGNGMGGLVEVAAEGFEAVGGYLAGSRYSRLLDDLKDARESLLDAQETLRGQTTKDPDLINPIIKAMDALVDYQDAGISLVNAQITAVDMMAGGETAKVVSKFLNNGTGFSGGGVGTMAAVGAAGLGIGLLLSNNNSNDRNSPRRRR